MICNVEIRSFRASREENCFSSLQSIWFLLYEVGCWTKLVVESVFSHIKQVVNVQVVF